MYESTLSSTSASKKELRTASFEFVGGPSIRSLQRDKQKLLRRHVLQKTTQRPRRPHKSVLAKKLRLLPDRSLILTERRHPRTTSEEKWSKVRLADDQHNADIDQLPDESADVELPKHLSRDLIELLPGTASPQTFLNASRADPFGVYPFELEPFEHQILDFQYNTLPEIEYGHTPKAPLCYMRICTDRNVQDEAVLHLMLSFTMYRWAAFNGASEAIYSKALSHKIKGLKLVNMKLNDTVRGVDNFNVQSTVLMTAIEGRTGKIRSFRRHWEGLHSMLALRGGLTELGETLVWQICSAELRLLDKAGIEHLPCQDPWFPRFAQEHGLAISKYLSWPPAVISPSILSPDIYISACVYEFLHVLPKFQLLSEDRNNYHAGPRPPPHTSFPAAECVSVRSTFRPQSPLHIILLPSRIIPDHNINAVARMIYEQSTVRLVCLFYIHVTLWAFRQEPFRTDAYMAKILSHTVRNNLDKSWSVEGLLWILLWVALTERDRSFKESVAESRLVLRLMRVARYLTLDMWKSLERNMFDALVGVESQHAGLRRGGSHGAWVESDRIREEVSWSTKFELTDAWN